MPEPSMFAPIPILLYHRVDNSGGPFVTPPEVFSQHLGWLADRGYRTLRPRELTQMLSGASSMSGRADKAVMITFDDGYADLETSVAPALREHGFNATAFLITSRCPSQPVADSEHLSWSAARSLATEGVLEFQSHTHTHSRWSIGRHDTASVRDDIATSLAVLSDELGRPKTSFSHLAWPWGRTCPEWEDVAARMGVASQYVVQRGAANRAGQHRRLPRVLLDGVSLPHFQRWMGLLSNGPGALACNQVFGTIRQLRRGAGYR